MTLVEQMPILQSVGMRCYDKPGAEVIAGWMAGALTELRWGRESDHHIHRTRCRES